MPAPDYNALLAMPAGPELDAAVARLLGWHVEYCRIAGLSGYALVAPDGTILNGWNASGYYIDRRGPWQDVDAYSTDLNAAIELTIPGYDVMVCGNEAAVGKRYATAFEDSVSQTGDNPAHAVCRVWLRAARWSYFVPPGLAKEGDR